MQHNNIIENIPQLKIKLYGPGNCGKDDLFRYFTQQTDLEKYTQGNDVYQAFNTIELGNTLVKLNLFAKDYHSEEPDPTNNSNYYKPPHVCLIVIDLADSHSLKLATEMLNKIRKTQEEDGMKLILVANQRSLNAKFTRQEIQNFAKDNKLDSFVITNTQTGNQVLEAFFLAAAYACLATEISLNENIENYLEKNRYDIKKDFYILAPQLTRYKDIAISALEQAHLNNNAGLIKTHTTILKFINHAKTAQSVVSYLKNMITQLNEQLRIERFASLKEYQTLLYHIISNCENPQEIKKYHCQQIEIRNIMSLWNDKLKLYTYLRKWSAPQGHGREYLFETIKLLPLAMQKELLADCLDAKNHFHLGERFWSGFGKSVQKGLLKKMADYYKHLIQDNEQLQNQDKADYVELYVVGIPFALREGIFLKPIQHSVKNFLQLFFSNFDTIDSIRMQFGIDSQDSMRFCFKEIKSAYKFATQLLDMNWDGTYLENFEFFDGKTIRPSHQKKNLWTGYSCPIYKIQVPQSMIDESNKKYPAMDNIKFESIAVKIPNLVTLDAKQISRTDILEISFGEDTYDLQTSIPSDNKIKAIADDFVIISPEKTQPKLEIQPIVKSHQDQLKIQSLVKAYSDEQFNLQMILNNFEEKDIEFAMECIKKGADPNTKGNIILSPSLTLLEILARADMNINHKYDKFINELIKEHFAKVSSGMGHKYKEHAQRIIAKAIAKRFDDQEQLTTYLQKFCNAYSPDINFVFDTLCNLPHEPQKKLLSDAIENKESILFKYFQKNTSAFALFSTDIFKKIDKQLNYLAALSPTPSDTKKPQDYSIYNIL